MLQMLHHPVIAAALVAVGCAAAGLQNPVVLGRACVHVTSCMIAGASMHASVYTTCACCRRG